MKNKGGRPKTGDGRFARARALWESGVKRNEIGKEMRISRYTVDVYLMKGGIPREGIESEVRPTDWNERHEELTEEYPSFADAMTALMLEWTPSQLVKNCRPTPIAARHWGMERTWVTA